MAGVFVGLDNGGTSNNATVLTDTGTFLVEGLHENPSRVREGPDAALEALAQAFDSVLAAAGCDRADVRAVGLDTPGPASATGVISVRGSTNFGHAGWRGFDIRSALQALLALPVVYNNDGNAASLYAHTVHHGVASDTTSSVSAIVGTGLGGGIVCNGQIVSGAAGMAGEVGHVHIPLDGLLVASQPVPTCNCGFRGDTESLASLTAIERNLLPFWLGHYPGHPLGELPIAAAAREVRRYGEAGDELALRIFEQQAAALGRLFTIAANMVDPDTYFVGGGVVQAEPSFAEWFLGRVREHTRLREEQAAVATFQVVPDLDTAGARGSALAAAAFARAARL
jgi:predicted NBD/HSP70 family sugar kinase